MSNAPTDLAEIRAIAERRWAEQGFMHAIGAELGEVSPGSAQVFLPRSEGVLQGQGYFHGGAIGALVDATGGASVGTLVAEGDVLLAVEYKVNFLAPAVGEKLEAVGTVLKAGRTLSVGRVDVYAHNGDTRKLVAAGQMTGIRVEG